MMDFVEIIKALEDRYPDFQVDGRFIGADSDEMESLRKWAAPRPPMWSFYDQIEVKLTQGEYGAMGYYTYQWGEPELTYFTEEFDSMFLRDKEMLMEK